MEEKTLPDKQKGLLDLAKNRLAQAQAYHDQGNVERTRQAHSEVFNIVEDLERFKVVTQP